MSTMNDRSGYPVLSVPIYRLTIQIQGGLLPVECDPAGELPSPQSFALNLQEIVTTTGRSVSERRSLCSTSWWSRG